MLPWQVVRGANEEGFVIRTLVVDDNEVFLNLAESFLSAQAGIEVIGFAKSGEEALEKVSSLKPDLVIMDLAMPGINGFQATRMIKKLENPPKVIILTLHDLHAYRNMAKAMGADDFVTKDDFGEPLLTVIHNLFPAEPVREDPPSPNSPQA